MTNLHSNFNNIIKGSLTEKEIKVWLENHPQFKIFSIKKTVNNKEGVDFELAHNDKVLAVQVKKL
ncbi:hypothetical protein [Candidatus Phytoplasma fraxini]|uniref:Restriction endonuclease type IV Mrr domain-containing protein n=1 Tax=Ash yellows phytoplasma TaxID=35780 RepID=A0ABZ2U9N7_ASHYP